MLTIFPGDADPHLAAVLAFPRLLEHTVRAVSAVVSRGQSHTPHPQAYYVKLRGETLQIPVRTYYDATALREGCARSGAEGTVARCLGTRHDDGFMREQCVIGLLESDQYWTAPFLIHLLGEYVVEVIAPIERMLQEGVPPAFREFVAENPSYMVTLEKRAISYWSCYYRVRFPNKADYPGLHAIAALKAV